MLMGRLAHNAEWLDRIIGLPPDLKQLISTEMKEAFRLRMLIFIRWAMVMICFEREFYRDPDQDLNTLWWDLVERFQFLTRPDRRDEPDLGSKDSYCNGAGLLSQLSLGGDSCFSVAAYD